LHSNFNEKTHMI